MAKKIVVTGSEGFIGKALCRQLEIEEADIIRIDRKLNIEAAEWFANADLSDIGLVFHLAAQTSVFNDDREAIMSDNVETFRIIADRCAKERIKLVYASSSTANPDNTTSLYGLTKRFDEEYARLYCPTAIGVRFHNVYGPDPRKGTLLWHLLNESSVKLYNLGRNIRHFTYIDDIVAGLLLSTAYAHPVVNIANPEATTTRDFAREVQKYNGVEIQLVAEKREKDRLQQELQEGIHTLSLPYTTVKEGIAKICTTT